MRKLYKVLLAAILLPVLSYAQSNYKPGYVVDLKGDTLKGFIDYREWGSNPDVIDFKTAVTDKESKRFSPSDINYFNIAGLDSYQRYVGLISMDATDKDHLGSFRDSTYKNAVVFIRILQKGKNLSLYSYTDDIKVRFYVGEAPDYMPKELIYRLYYNYGSNTVKGQNGVTVNENTYMRQLFAFANKYGILDEALQRDIERTDYTEDNIASLVSRINNISKTEYAKSNQPRGPIFNVFVGAGANIDNISTAAGSSFEAGGGKSYTSTGGMVSVGVNFFINPIVRRFQLRLEVGVAQSQFRSLYTLKVSPYIPFKASFDELSVSLAPQVLYNFYNAENFKVFASVGYVLKYYKFSNVYFGSQSQPNSATDIERNEPYYFSSSQNSVVFKAGIQIHKNWGIFAQYMASVPFTENPYWSLSSKCEQIGINYYFW
ncbi:MAG TPA: hypothetical protein VK671_11140 [Mucilaginibacter sp.]|jgi:hypothetical protein|nr:hypothetical protein [Mucilaginibacter sp.]